MDFFIFGEIVKTRGLHGCLKALCFLESQDVLDGLDFVYLESKSGRQSRHELKKINSSGNFLFIELNGVSSVNEAQQLVGSKLLLPRDLLEKLPDDEYYWHDIIGLEVRTLEGRRLGCIESIFPTGSNDVYVCRGEEGEILIPAIADVVRRVDLASRSMTVTLLEGL